MARRFAALLIVTDTVPLPLGLNDRPDAAAGISGRPRQRSDPWSTHPGKDTCSTVKRRDEYVKVFDLGSEPVGRAANPDIEYLSPEQYVDTSAGDGRSDIYSLGVILYEMLAGVVPFVGKTTAELIQKQESEPPPPLSAFRSDLPADLEPMILTAMAIDPRTALSNDGVRLPKIWKFSRHAVSGPVNLL